MTFAQPWFLWGLFSLAVPIIIHLFNFRKPKTIQFSSIKFIKESVIEVNKTQKIKHLLVLLSRLLFLLFLIFAFTQPQFQKNARKTGLVAIYVDNSNSMLAPSKTGDILANAIETVNTLVQNLPSNTPYLFIDNDYKSTDLNVLNREQLKDRLTELEVSSKAKSVEEVHKKIILNAEKLGYGDNLQAFMLSDFQKSVHQDFKLEHIPTQLLQSKSTNTFNVFVDTVFLESPIVIPDENSVIKVVVSCVGEVDAENIPVKLIIDGVTAGTTQLKLSKNQNQTIEFNARLKNQQITPCKIVIDDNSIVFDNEYYFVLNPIKPINVTLISNKPQNTIADIFKNDPAFRFENYTFNAINFGKLNQTQLLIIDDFDQSDNLLMDYAQKLLKQNASVVLIPGIAYKNSNLTNNIKLLTNQNLVIEQDTSRLAKELVQMPDLRNPFFKNVFKNKQDNIQLPFAKIIINTSKTEIYKSNLGKQVVSKYELPQGNIYLVNTILSPEYSSLQTHPFFITMMIKIALNCNNTEEALSHTLDTKTIKLSNSNLVNSNKIILKSSNQELVPTIFNQNSYHLLDINNLPLKSGFYKVFMSDSLVKSLAFNTNKLESNIQCYTFDELKSKTANFKNIKVYNTDSIESTVKDIKQEINNNYLWKYCLALALFFLAIEIALLKFLK